MGALVWTMVGLAIWHFTIFLPDRFWGGIVGAFIGALFGSIFVGTGDQRLHGARAERHGPRHRAGGDSGRGFAGIAAVYFWGAHKGIEPLDVA